jgi:endoglucanase
VHSYISNMTGGNDGVLAQLAVFRLKPWEQQACTSLPGAAAQASYRTWIDNAAAGIGASRVALILQPDLPFALCGSRHIGSSIQLALVRYAAARLSALAHTTVYIDAGAGDWESVSQAVWLLRRAGVRYTRGFSVNDTHFDSTGNELRFGASVVAALAREGIRGRHFVINTAENGSPFQFWKFHGHGDPPACGDTSSRICATLGIPPTWRTADLRWGLSRRERSIASRYADAYLWIGRPWLDNGAYPFDLRRALSMATSTPF